MTSRSLFHERIVSRIRASERERQNIRARALETLLRCHATLEAVRARRAAQYGITPSLEEPENFVPESCSAHIH